MKTICAKDIMVPLADYATVSQTATLMQAIRALQNENKMFGDKPYRHRALLVLDDDGKVVGKISQVDIMRALEPNYSRIGGDVGLARLGFSPTFIAALKDQYKLWEKPISELCKAIDSVKVTEVMYTPEDHQKVKETDTLDMAMHQIVMGHHQSLLVTRNKEIVGILRSTDVFNALYDTIQQCTI